jgi:hypothetical protein
MLDIKLHCNAEYHNGIYVEMSFRYLTKMLFDVLNGSG